MDEPTESTPQFRTIAAQFDADGQAQIDYVARILDPAKPKLGQAVRHLVRIGYEHWLKEHKAKQTPPTPPALADEDRAA